MVDICFLDAAVTVVERDGVVTGLNACYAKQVLRQVVSDPSIIEHLVLQIFGPIAQQQADGIRQTVLAYGGTEEQVKVLTHKFGQGILLGGAEGLLS